MQSHKLVGLVVELAIGLTLFGVIVALLQPLEAKDPVTGASTSAGMTNATVSLLTVIPLVVIVGFVLAAVYVAIRE